MDFDFKQHLDTYPNFPKPGILFYDISPLLRDHYFRINTMLFKQVKERFKKSFYSSPTVYAGIESRGFLIAGMLATNISSHGAMMVRKQGKLPGNTVLGSVKLEYGQAVLEVKPGCGDVVLCDDVVATGGTLKGAEKLLTEAGYNVIEKVCLLNLTHLNDFSDDELISLIKI